MQQNYSGCDPLTLLKVEELAICFSDLSDADRALFLQMAHIVIGGSYFLPDLHALEVEGINAAMILRKWRSTARAPVVRALG